MKNKTIPIELEIGILTFVASAGAQGQTNRHYIKLDVTDIVHRMSAQLGTFKPEDISNRDLDRLILEGLLIGQIN